MTARRPSGPQAVALALLVALVVVLSLDWFAFVAPPNPGPTAEQRDHGIILLLNAYSLEDFHASGWAGLGWLPVALIVLAAAGIVAGLALEATVAAAIALSVLVVTLAREDDTVGLRWPAYAGVALTAGLLGCAVWSWRARPGQTAPASAPRPAPPLS